MSSAAAAKAVAIERRNYFCHNVCAARSSCKTNERARISSQRSARRSIPSGHFWQSVGDLVVIGFLSGEYVPLDRDARGRIERAGGDRGAALPAGPPELIRSEE